MTGKAVGKAYVNRFGLGTVFEEPDHPNHFTIQIDRTGERLFKHRDRIQWRPTEKKESSVTKYIPEVGPKTIPAHVEKRTVDGILNPLPIDTRIRATLGETSIVGYVSEHQSRFNLIDITIEHPDYPAGEEGPFMAGYSLWLESGWEFEILDDRPTAPEDARELTESVPA